MMKEDRLMKFALHAMMGILALLLTTPAGFAAGNIEINGAVATLGESEFTWNSQNFAGFYYDLDKNIGTEQITLRLSESDGATAVLSDVADANGYPGVVYMTTAQTKNLKFNPWGSYLVIGFLGEPYFAAYSSAVTSAMESAGVSVPLLYDRSKNRNLMTNEQISRVLMDDNTETYISSAEPLKLEEGYELAIKSVNTNETSAVVELKKNGQSIDTKIVQPSLENSVLSDQTYFYRRSMGNTQDIVTIAVHFKNLFRGNNESYSATVNGIFQISDTPTPIKPDQQYGKMMIRNIDSNSMTITMDNKDNRIVLTRNKDIPLVKDIHIKTADQSDVSMENPLRYYLYKEVSCNR
jgi:S-layer protein (TIGR01567 family)